MSFERLVRCYSSCLLVGLLMRINVLQASLTHNPYSAPHSLQVQSHARAAAKLRPLQQPQGKMLRIVHDGSVQEFKPKYEVQERFSEFVACKL